MNVWAATGRFTAEPELRKTQSNTSVCSFTIAVDANYTPKGEEKKANFIECVAWDKTADFICKWFHKGNMIAVQGEMQTRNWEDKNGNKRKTTECVIDKAFFCEGKKEGTPVVEPSVPEYYEVPDEPSLPF
jgi:single-strand DNA-binding protein